jgi:glycosyltransferase involved in cell wall biosynthesis
MQDVTLVIPAKFESESLPRVLKEIESIAAQKIIVIPKDDLTTLNSIKDYDHKIIHQNEEGFGAALIEGINSVQTKYFCIFNADGSFDPKYLKGMREKLDLKNDFVFSTRYERNSGSEDDTMLTFLGNKIFTFTCRVLFKLNISDVLFTYVMGSTSACKSLNLKNKDFTFCIELPVKAKFLNYKSTNYPSYERSRIAGKKKVNEFKDGFLILMSIISLFLFKK